MGQPQSPRIQRTHGLVPSLTPGPQSGAGQSAGGHTVKWCQAPHAGPDAMCLPPPPPPKPRVTENLLEQKLRGFTEGLF